jgi:IS1 family transposase
MERTSKFVITWLNGKRSSENTWEFVNDLYYAATGRYQVSTDGYGPYAAAFPLIYQFGVDFAQLIKRFGGTSDVDGSRRYSPANLVSKETTVGCGSPDEDRVCTSHSERLNLSLRMQMRRFTRLTNGHSKCWENHAAMIGLYFGWYNYCRVHSTIKTTPAVAQGLANKPWSIEELLMAAA